MITYKTTKEIDVEKVKSLYEDVKWTGYTKDEAIISSIVPNAYQVFSAWDGEQLIGLCRSISDGVYILYIQDLLVKEAYQGKGIGSELLQQMLAANSDIRQKVLLTEYAESKMAFYEKNGFKRADNPSAGIAFVQYTE